MQITTNTEYVPDYLNEIVEQLVLLWELDTSTFVYGSGKRKSKEQRHYEHLTTFCQKLQEYIRKLEFKENSVNYNCRIEPSDWGYSATMIGLIRIFKDRNISYRTEEDRRVY